MNHIFRLFFKKKKKNQEIQFKPPPQSLGRGNGKHWIWRNTLGGLVWQLSLDDIFHPFKVKYLVRYKHIQKELQEITDPKFLMILVSFPTPQS